MAVLVGSGRGRGVACSERGPEQQPKQLPQDIKRGLDKPPCASSRPLQVQLDAQLGGSGAAVAKQDAALDQIAGALKKEATKTDEEALEGDLAPKQQPKEDGTPPLTTEISKETLVSLGPQPGAVCDGGTHKGVRASVATATLLPWLRVTCSPCPRWRACRTPRLSRTSKTSRHLQTSTVSRC
jgi:hypothetical protein